MTKLSICSDGEPQQSPGTQSWLKAWANFAALGPEKGESHHPWDGEPVALSLTSATTHSSAAATLLFQHLGTGKAGTRRSSSAIPSHLTVKAVASSSCGQSWPWAEESRAGRKQ